MIQTIVIIGLFLGLMLLGFSLDLLEIRDNVFTLQGWVLFDQPLVNLHAEVVALAQLLNIILEQRDQLPELWFHRDLQALLNDVISIVINQQVEKLIFVTH